jgi:DNA primase
MRVSEDVLKADLGRVLLKLEALQDESIQAALKPKTPAQPAMTADEHMAALHLLNDKDLPARILADFEAVGVVGEATNKLVG